MPARQFFVSVRLPCAGRTTLTAWEACPSEEEDCGEKPGITAGLRTYERPFRAINSDPQVIIPRNPRGTLKPNAAGPAHIDGAVLEMFSDGRVTCQYQGFVRDEILRT